MGKGPKIVTTVLWGMTVFAMLGVVGTGLWAKKARGRQAPGVVSADDLPKFYQAPAFELTDQENRTVTDAQLRGSAWVAIVFFTNCPDICPGMMGRLVDLQEAVKDPNVKLVSFSIDPERDTPQRLKQYAD